MQLTLRVIACVYLSTNPDDGIVSCWLPIKPLLVSNTCRAAMSLVVPTTLYAIKMALVSNPNGRTLTAVTVMNTCPLLRFALWRYSHRFQNGHSIALNNNRAALRFQIR